MLAENAPASAWTAWNGSSAVAGEADASGHPRAAMHLAVNFACSPTGRVNSFDELSALEQNDHQDPPRFIVSSAG